MKVLNKKEIQRQISTEKILSSALDLCVRVGYSGTTIDTIASQAKLTKGAVYFYFNTKEAILLALLDQAEKWVVDPIPDYLSPEVPADEKLVTFIHSQSKVGLTHPQHVLLLILVSIDFAATDSEIEARVRAIYRKMYSYVEQIIEQGQREGVFRSDLSSHQLTAIVIAGHDGVLIEWYRRPKELTGKDLATALRATLLTGLLQYASPPRKTGRRRSAARSSSSAT